MRIDDWYSRRVKENPEYAAAEEFLQREEATMGRIQMELTPLYCRKCKSHNIAVTGARQMLNRNSRKQLHAEVRCDACGNVWWSSHTTALELSRKADAEQSATGPHVA